MLLPLVQDGVSQAGTSAEMPPLLLLHGFTGSAASWSPFVADWSQRLGVLRVDLPGHGRVSPTLPLDAYRMPAVADALFRTLDHHAIDQINLLGYSMGGRLALYLAAHFPDRIHRLILESSSPGLKTTDERTERITRDNKLADFIEREGIEAFVDRWEALPLWQSQQQLDEATRAAHRAARLRNHPTGLANSLRGMGTGQQPSLWEALPRIALPTLLVVGEFDEKFVRINAAISAEMPHSQLVVVPNAGHTVHLEQPQAYREHVLAFLTKSTAPR